MVPNDHDDDALTWDDGTDDATHVDARPRTAASAAGVAAAPSAADAPAAGSASLVIYGILAGAYLLFTVGWIIAAGRDTYTVPNLLGEIMYQLGQFLAIVAPVLWFAVTFLMTRHRGVTVRLIWLATGAVVLAPWPFVLSGVVA